MSKIIKSKLVNLQDPNSKQILKESIDHRYITIKNSDVVKPFSTPRSWANMSDILGNK